MDGKGISHGAEGKVGALAALLLAVVMSGGCDDVHQQDISVSRDGGSPVAEPAQSDVPPSTQPAQTDMAPSTQPAQPTKQATGQSASTDDDAAPERLYGTWVAKNVDAPMGSVDIQLTFREEGPLRLLAWSDIPLVGQVRNKTGPFEVRGNTIHSDAIRDGTTVEYRFTDQGQLIIQYADGKTVTFHRQ